MAFAEKRGKKWRVRYLKPDGEYGSESGFDTKTEALNFGKDQESDVRRYAFIDPKLAQTPFAEFVEIFMTESEVSKGTRQSREDRLKVLLPQFGNMPLVAIDWFMVKNWAARLPHAPRTVRDFVSLLSTILTAAVDARYIPVNPIRGRKLGNNKKKPEKVWATPLQVLRLYFALPAPVNLMVLLAAYTGMRWGEVTGLHRRNVLLKQGIIRIDPDEGALHETGGKLYLGPPKPPNGARDIALPPFLIPLLEEFLKTHKHDIVFAGARGGFWRRSNFAHFYMRPYCDGRAEVIKTNRWGKQYVSLKALPAILPGLEFHGLRHSQKTWMEEDGIPEIAQCARMGHELEGVRGIYTHVTDEMIERLTAALQARWEKSLSDYLDWLGALDSEGLALAA